MTKLTSRLLNKTQWTLTVYKKDLTLSQTTIFRLFQIERLCRQQFRIIWKWQIVLQTVGKHCGKRRNCSLRAISPFPTVFSKDLYCRHVKTRACLGKGSTSCVCETLMPLKLPFFRQLWPWYLTLTFTDDLELGTNRRSCQNLYMCEIWKP